MPTPAEPLQPAYPALLRAALAFFETGVPPVPPEETLEIMAFMEAADRSKERQGEPVALGELAGAAVLP